MHRKIKRDREYPLPKPTWLFATARQHGYGINTAEKTTRKGPTSPISLSDPPHTYRSAPMQGLGHCCRQKQALLAPKAVQYLAVHGRRNRQHQTYTRSDSRLDGTAADVGWEDLIWLSHSARDL